MFEFQGVISLSLQIACDFMIFHNFCILQCMLVKQRLYYRACDSTQDGIFGKKIVTSLWPVRSDRSFKPWQILYKEHAYFGMMKKESSEQRESTFTNSAMILKNITLLDPKNSKNSRITPQLLS